MQENYPTLFESNVWKFEDEISFKGGNIKLRNLGPEQILITVTIVFA